MNRSGALPVPLATSAAMSPIRGANLAPCPEQGEARLLVATHVGTTRLIDNAAVTLGSLPG